MFVVAIKIEIFQHVNEKKSLPKRDYLIALSILIETIKFEKNW